MDSHTFWMISGTSQNYHQIWTFSPLFLCRHASTNRRKYGNILKIFVHISSLCKSKIYKVFHTAGHQQCGSFLFQILTPPPQKVFAERETCICVHETFTMKCTHAGCHDLWCCFLWCCGFPKINLSAM